jgi:hypothetical protein
MKRQVLGLGSCTFLAVAPLIWGQGTVDPPSRVARLSFVEGSVSFRPASGDDWVAATLNYPLTSGDRLWTTENAYAEIHIGATAINLSQLADFTLSRLDDTVTRMSLSQGTIYVRIPTLGQGEVVAVDTPNGAISLLQTGTYRVDVENTTTSVRVRSGEADVLVNGRMSKVRPGTMLQLVANQDVWETQDVPPPDEWEQACAARDQWAEQYLEASESYVPPEMEGAEDLAQYGTWSADATYGAVWCPAGVAAGWAPYRNGRWAFISPWGWTWIDDAPWGFAPFHYGRWLFEDGHWFWVPGNRDQHPIYSPALVVFLGRTRLRASLAARGGPVTGWIPLGPGEIYHPPYLSSERYLRLANAPSVRDFSGARSTPATYRNRDQMIVVPQATLTGARPVAGAALRIPAGAATGAELVNIGDVKPVRQSYLGRRADPLVKVATPPSGAVSRAVVVKHEIPPAAKPVAPTAPAESTATAQQRENVHPTLAPAKPARPLDDPIARQTEQQRAEQQRVEQQHADQQRAEQQRAVQQRADQQRAEQQRAEQQRSDQQRAGQQRADQQRADQQRAEQQRADQQRAEQQRADQQRAEQQRAEQQRAAQQRADQQRADQQRAEHQRADQQRADQQRAEQQRAEQQRADEAKKADEARKKQ